MQDRTDHVLAAIDGALDWHPDDGDAMRWTPEPQRPTPPPALPGLHFDPEQFARASASLAPLAQAVQEATRQIGEAYLRSIRQVFESPGFRQLAEFANSPEGRALIAAREQRDDADAHPCHCLCVKRHGDRMGICTGDAVATARYVSVSVGTVDIPMCGPCLDPDSAP
jgi:hypothetical protein